MQKSGEFWFQVRDCAKRYTDPKSQALYLWLEPEDGVIPTNKRGFPYGVPLRPVSERLVQLGHCNGKGKKFHPYQLQEMIFDGFADTFCRLRGLILDREQRHALKAALEEGVRQKRSYVMDEEWETRCSWRALKRPVKMRRPWDQDSEVPDVELLRIGRIREQIQAENSR